MMNKHVEYSSNFSSMFHSDKYFWMCSGLAAHSAYGRVNGAHDAFMALMDALFSLLGALMTLIDALLVFMETANAIG